MPTHEAAEWASFDVNEARKEERRIEVVVAPSRSINDFNLAGMCRVKSLMNPICRSTIKSGSHRAVCLPFHPIHACLTIILSQMMCPCAGYPRLAPPHLIAKKDTACFGENLMQTSATTRVASTRLSAYATRQSICDASTATDEGRRGRQGSHGPAHTAGGRVSNGCDRRRRGIPSWVPIPGENRLRRSGSWLQH